jgi:hypothetical protein
MCRRLAHSGACVLISISAHGRTALCVICIDGLQDLKVVQQRLVHRRTLVFGRRPVPLHPVVRLTQRERETHIHKETQREWRTQTQKNTNVNHLYSTERCGTVRAYAAHLSVWVRANAYKPVCVCM